MPFEGNVIGDLNAFDSGDLSRNAYARISPAYRDVAGTMSRNFWHKSVSCGQPTCSLDFRNGPRELYREIKTLRYRSRRSRRIESGWISQDSRSPWNPGTLFSSRSRPLRILRDRHRANLPETRFVAEREPDRESARTAIENVGTRARTEPRNDILEPDARTRVFVCASRAKKAVYTLYVQGNATRAIINQSPVR